MASVDVALDDIISKNKKSFRGRGAGTGRGGRGRGGNRGASQTRRTSFRGASSRGASSRGGNSRGGSTRGVSTRGASSRGISTSSFRNQRSNNVNGNWSHDLYYGGTSSTRTPVAKGPTKLNISNLDYGVSDSDIKELFNEFGAMRTAAIHYDRSGRSLGSAHVIFDKRYDAQKAIKQYNGVHLDGRPMSIVIDGEPTAVSNGSSDFSRGRGGRRGAMGGRTVKRLQGAPRAISDNASRAGGNTARGRSPRGGRGRGRGGRASRGGGRGAKTKTPTAQELDAELDAYVVQGAKK